MATMRGGDNQTEGLFSYVSCEARVPAGHPLRPIRAMVDEALDVLSGDFEGLYSKVGRPSIPPEKLLRALLLQAFYTVRSERQLMEQLEYNLLFRWFVGLSLDAPVWDVTVFTKNRERLLAGDVATKFLAAVVAQARSRDLLSDEHFSVDGTLIEAWASLKSFRPKDGSGEPPAPGRNGEADFHGEKRSNETHTSATDPEARLYRKGNGQSSRMAFMGHVLMENRNALVVRATLTQASGTAEREAALSMLDTLPTGAGTITLGADKGYDAASFIGALRTRHDHVTKTGKRRTSAAAKLAAENAANAQPATENQAAEKAASVDLGYALSLRLRKRIEEIFGWTKTTGTLRKTRHKGTKRVGWMFTLTAAAYNLVRLPKLTAA